MSFVIDSSFLPDGHRKRLASFYRKNEADCVRFIVEKTIFQESSKIRIENLTYQVIEKVRDSKITLIELFLKEFNLSTEEGVALMCLAEAFLRIPDDTTINELMKDKIATSNWTPYLEKSSGIFIHASVWGLLLTGSILKDKKTSNHWVGVLDNLLKRISTPVVRTACKYGMELFGNDFVLGENIDEALEASKKISTKKAKNLKAPILFSFDMLGEASRTKEDSERYFNSYMNAIKSIGNSNSSDIELSKQNGISIKLSALHPRYEFIQHKIITTVLFQDILKLCLLAKELNVPVCIDAEESYRLEISLMILKALLEHEKLKGWNGLGIAVQAYQKRAIATIDYLQELSIQTGSMIPIRLVKGAYWDYEIKYAQENGFSDYPVFTRKVYTDLSYIFCAQKLIEGSKKYFYPCFATHNAHTISSILEFVSRGSYGFEFQRLYGMGASLYDYVLGDVAQNVSCRVYAPVGNKNDLLPYLIRRILENGANSSFLHKLSDKSVSLSYLASDPFAKAKSLEFKSHSSIPLPTEMYGKFRKNSLGFDFNDSALLSNLYSNYKEFSSKEFSAYPLINGQNLSSEDSNPVCNPAHPQRCPIGSFFNANNDELLLSLTYANKAFSNWSSKLFSERASILRKAADLLEENSQKLTYLLTSEAGKIVADAISEVREAVDFLRYYSRTAEVLFDKPEEFLSPIGEMNSMLFEGKGVFLCISPWNFPLAIFLGQIAAALVCGNTVLAKPSEQTTVIAYEAVKLLHEAGIPTNVLQLVIGEGRKIGSVLIPDHRIAGIAFTGSNATADSINSVLAKRGGAIIPFIAETGGINAMIVDSSALAEQVTVDVVNSAFKSAGQRCSSLRLLFVQEEIAERQIRMIRGAMNELKVGDPMDISTDIGPIIDAKSLESLKSHIEDMNNCSASLLCRTPISDDLNGFYMPPHMYELKKASDLTREVFGPILHVVRYKKNEFNKVIDDINNSGYGLTFGIHSRINSTIDYVLRNINVGNVYVNRNQIGAVVGVQPFGGRGLSGTGPKAGGPTYLYRFVSEKVISINTAAIGGDVSIMSIED